MSHLIGRHFGKDGTHARCRPSYVVAMTRMRSESWAGHGSGLATLLDKSVCACAVASFFPVAPDEFRKVVTVLDVIRWICPLA